MLIKRTPWMYLCEYEFINRAHTLSVCVMGVNCVFNLPPKVKAVRFYLHDRYLKGAVKVRASNAYLSVGGLRADIIDYMSEKAIDKLEKKQRYYYVECEYKE